jgi:hypothetical protein
VTFNDPIEKQQALVAALTQGQVKWTVVHRDALRALDEGKTLQGIPPRIWKDLQILLEVLDGRLHEAQTTQ